MSVSGWRSLEIIREQLHRFRSGQRDSSLDEILTNTPNTDVLQKTPDNIEISRFIRRHRPLTHTSGTLQPHIILITQC